MWIAFILASSWPTLASERLAQPAYREAPGTLGRMSESVYDMLSAEACAPRAVPSEEVTALRGVRETLKFPKLRDLTTVENMYFSTTAGMQSIHLNCDLPKAYIFSHRDLDRLTDDTLEKIQGLRWFDEMIEKETARLRPVRAQLLRRFSGDDLQVQMSEAGAELKKLVAAKAAIRGSIRMIEYGPMRELIDQHLAQPNSTSLQAYLAPIDRDQLRSNLKHALSATIEIMHKDRDRMDKALRDPITLTAGDRNALAKDVAPLTRVASASQLQTLAPLQCALNRRYGKGRDWLETAIDLTTLPISLGAGAVGVGLKAVSLARRTGSAITLARARMLQAAALVVDATALAREVSKCLGESTATTSREGAGQCADVDAVTKELDHDNCVLNSALFLMGAAGSAYGLKKLAEANPTVPPLKLTPGVAESRFQPIVRPNPTPDQWAALQRRAKEQMNQIGGEFKPLRGAETYGQRLARIDQKYSPPGQVYRVEKLPPAGSSLRADQSVWTHPDMAKKLRELREQGFDVAIDPSLDGTGAGGVFFDKKYIYLRADAQWRELIHEAQHADFSRTVDQYFPMKRMKTMHGSFDVIDGGPKLSVQELPEAIRSTYSLREQELIVKYHNRGLPRDGLNEELSVGREMEALGWRRYQPRNILHRNYATQYSVHQLERLERAGTLTDAQRAHLRKSRAIHDVRQVVAVAGSIASSRTVVAAGAMGTAFIADVRTNKGSSHFVLTVDKALGRDHVVDVLYNDHTMIHRYKSGVIAIWHKDGRPEWKWDF